MTLLDVRAICCKLAKQTTIALAQRQEYEADQYAATVTRPADLRSALIKIHRDALVFPTSDWLYSRWYYDHPTVVDRINAIE